LILDEIAYLIDSNSTTRTMGTNLFKGFEHSKAPNTCTFIHEYGGRSPELTLGNSSTPAWEYPRVQILDRSTDYQIARNAAEKWYRLLMNQTNTTLKPTSSATGARYLDITPVQSPFYVGTDENNRHEVACNYECRKYLST